METMTKPNISEMVAQAKQATLRAKSLLLKTFEYVPEDRLNWSPSADAKTPVQIVAHCAVSNTAFAGILRGEGPQLPSDPAEAIAFIRNGGSDVTSRKVAIQMIEDSVDEVLNALDYVSPDRMDSIIDTPFGPLPYTLFITLSGEHMTGHMCQIAYIQTIWGDLQDHM